MTADHPTRPTTRAGVAVAVVVLGLTAGCSAPPGPDDQRADVLAIADHVREAMVADGLSDVQVVDDGAETVPCAAGGERYRSLVAGLVDLSDATFHGTTGADDVVDARLDRVGRALSAAVATNPVAPDYFDHGRATGGDEPSARQEMYESDEGDRRGAWFTGDLVPLADGVVHVRLEASTACG